MKSAMITLLLIGLIHTNHYIIETEDSGVMSEHGYDYYSDYDYTGGHNNHSKIYHSHYQKDYS